MARKTLEERFNEKWSIDAETNCWVWHAGKDGWGYGLIKETSSRSNLKAHRLSYTLHRGPIPEGMVLDHLCRNRACVNPSHLEPVSNRENLLRGISFVSQNARKTHCPQGHEYTEENTYIYATRTKTMRQCRICRIAHGRKRTTNFFEKERSI